MMVCAAMAVSACGPSRGPAAALQSDGVPSGGTVATVPPPEAAAPETAADAPSVVDRAVIARVDEMRVYLRGLPSFEVRATTARGEVLADGQVADLQGTAQLLVRRPDRLRAEFTDDRQQRFFFYDGQTFTLWSRRADYYASVPAPPTLAQLARVLQTKYDVELPLVDLLHWGEQRPGALDPLAATDLGATQVGGVSCRHFALRQEGLDWQIWIQEGAYPLPRQLVLTTTTDPARPQYRVVLDWNLAPAFNDTAFTFLPAEGARRITIAETGHHPPR